MRFWRENPELLEDLLDEGIDPVDYLRENLGHTREPVPAESSTTDSAHE